MTGINELSNKLRSALAKDSQVHGTLRVVADELDKIARDCWHDPAERFPNTKDGRGRDGPVIQISQTGDVYCTLWRKITTQKTWRWARINDVLLMPPTE